MDFYHSQESIKKKLDKGLDASKNVLHKAREFIGNKIADAVTKLNDGNIEKQEPTEEIIIPPEKKWESIKEIGKSIIKMEHYKTYKLLNEVNDLSSDQYSVNKNIRFKTSM